MVVQVFVMDADVCEFCTNFTHSNIGNCEILLGDFYLN